jgi:Protein of unknown function (DUF2934)
MAKKPVTPAPKAAAPKTPTRATTPSAPPVSSPVRNTPVPKSQAAPKVITHEMISKKAYEIWQSGKGGSEYDNWVRAERELRGS